MRRLSLSAGLLALLSYGSCLWAATPAVIERDTVWSGTVQISEKVTVKAGVTLTIQPGTRIEIANQRGIWSNGTILALGEPSRPIVFTRAADAELWHQIMLENTTARFSHCIFEYSKNGVHVHASEVTISDSLFRYNESGAKLCGEGREGGEKATQGAGERGQGWVAISASRFEKNGFGLMPWHAKGVVQDSVITGNKVGILVRDLEFKDLAVRHNNIAQNSTYNLRMGDLNTGGGVDARENWWGGTEPQATIYDERNEPGIGLVTFEPFAKEPFVLGPVQK